VYGVEWKKKKKNRRSMCSIDMDLDRRIQTAIDDDDDDDRETPWDNGGGLLYHREQKKKNNVDNGYNYYYL
jgi:hypothetical protein